jgi:hypothetical protein
VYSPTPAEQTQTVDIGTEKPENTIFTPENMQVETNQAIRQTQTI